MAELIPDYPIERDALLYVGSTKGWRVDLLVEKLSSERESTIL